MNCEVVQSHFTYHDDGEPMGSQWGVGDSKGRSKRPFFLQFCGVSTRWLIFPFYRMRVAEILQPIDIQKKKAVFLDCLRERKTRLEPCFRICLTISELNCIFRAFFTEWYILAQNILPSIIFRTLSRR